MAVTEGQVLARLDDTTERSYLALADVQLGVAWRALAELKVRHEEAQTSDDLEVPLNRSGHAAAFAPPRPDTKRVTARRTSPKRSTPRE